MSSDTTDLYTGSPGIAGDSSTQPETPVLHPAATAGSTDPATREPAAHDGSGPARAAGPAAEAVTGQAGRSATTGLSGMLLPELQRKAQSLGITGTARMRKSQLVEAIQDKQGGGATAATQAAHRGAALDNSAQRSASAGADALRHREQDAMEPDRSTQPGLGEGTHSATSGREAPAAAAHEGAAGSGADSQLAFDHPGAGSAAPAGGSAADAAPGGEGQGDAQRNGEGHSGGDGQRGDRRRRNGSGRPDGQSRGGEAAEQRQDQGGQRGGQQAGPGRPRR